jgi:hypothetical protein
MLVRRYDHLLLVRANGLEFLRDYSRAIELSGDLELAPAHFYGKITSLSSQVGAGEVIDEFSARGIGIDKERTMVILQGEKPSTYRPAVPAVGILALWWLLAAVGLMRILNRNPGPRRRRARV